jgi:hypothetical protein
VEKQDAMESGILDFFAGQVIVGDLGIDYVGAEKRDLGPAKTAIGTRHGIKQAARQLK